MNFSVPSPVDSASPITAVRALRLAACLLMLVTCVAVFVPLSPEMPQPGLDPSWRFALAEATFRQMVFGHDIIFTFGPYAALYTRLYHPGTDAGMLATSLYLALSYAATLALVLGQGKRRWAVGFCVLMAAGAYVRDALFLSVPLLAALAIYQGLDKNARWLRAPRLAPVVVALLFVPLGLLPLVKGTMLLLCAAIIAWCGALLAAAGRRTLAAICLLCPALALAAFWSASGAPLSALPGYVTGMLPIVAGYTEAMSAVGSAKELWLYGLTTILLLAAIGCARSTPLRQRGFLLLLYGVFLFLCFKAGMVRQDEHALIGAGALLVAAMLLPLLLRSRLSLPALLVALLTANSIFDNYSGRTALERIKDPAWAYRDAWDGATRRLATPSWPGSDYALALARIRASAPLPRLAGSTDIYSFSQSALIAAGNQWRPRPVMQSYSAYTPALEELNRRHLLGPMAPDNIVFSVETIDGRLPSLDDGPSWPALLQDYAPVRMLGKAVLLRRRPQAAPTVAAAVPLGGRTARLDELVPVPPSAAPVYAQFDVQPSALGRLAGLLFRTRPLHMTVHLGDGSEQTFRIVSGMARAGFLLSPLVSDGSEFGALYLPAEAPARRQVRAFSVGAGTGTGTGTAGSLLWQRAYSVTFSNVAPAPVHGDGRAP